MFFREKLLLLADSEPYIKGNCYQHQLLKTLKKIYRVKIVSISDLQSPLKNFDDYSKILSVLRLRTLISHIDLICKRLDGRSLAIYEQDPWEAFRDESPYKGGYELINSKLNVLAFLNTSKWWSQYINSRGINSVFVRMGVLPEYCSVGNLWPKRKFELAFQGSMHPHRREFYDKLSRQSIEVSILPYSPYKKFLKNLQKVGIYIYTEDVTWIVDGVGIKGNVPWIKSIEVAARGCFVIRNYEHEAEAYGVSEIPTILTFKNTDEVPELVSKIRGMSNAEKNRAIGDSVKLIRSRNDWNTVIEALEGLFP
jgi:hypothetical protein